MSDSPPLLWQSVSPDLPSRVQYALLALLELARVANQKTPLNISEITAKQPIPDRYLEQILTNLRRGGIVQSQRGARGGYMLVRDPRQIKVLEVVHLIGGEKKEAERATLPTLERDVIHDVWQQANDASQQVLSRYTLQDLYERLEARQRKDPMYYI